MRWPTFLIIGAAKSGTTSLWGYLNQHPEVFLSRYKEPNYFALAGETLPRGGPAPADVLYYLIHRHSVTEEDKYLSLFSAVRDEKAIGEASVRYLYFSKAPERINDKLSDVRLIAILREPVSRLYSHYCMNVQYQLEPLTLVEAIKAEEGRRDANWGWDWHYVNVGLYSQQVQRYFDLFKRNQIKIVLYDDFVAKPLEVYQEVCQHIGVADDFIPDMSERGKVACRPKHLALDRWLHWPNANRDRLLRILPRKQARAVISRLETWNSRPVPKLDPQLRLELSELFREDVRRLALLLDREIPWYSQRKQTGDA